jgi:aldehyde:ferredoxin oxidoreductase
MFGWRGQLLRVNLTSGAIATEPLKQTTIRSCLGGRGLGIHLLAKEPSSGNKLIFTTGPLTGTLAPNGGRYTVVTRTMPAGQIAAASISGSFGPELKFAGLDGIVVEGEAAAPVYLWIRDSAAELRPAGHISGKPVSATTDALLAETDRQAIVTCIGPAGESGAGNAILATNHISAAGGNGIGAAMGAKNLKAIVVRGTQGFRVCRIQEFAELATKLRASMVPIAAQGVFVSNAVLVAESVVWDKASADLKPARPHGCFGCATSFSSFAFDEGQKSIALTAGNLETVFENPPLAEYRKSIDLGLDFVKEKLGGESYCPMDRGACIAGGYPIIPRLSFKNGQDTALDLLSLLDSVGLCPFLAAGIEVGAIAGLLSAATGISFSEDEIVQAGRRISELIRQTA